MTTFADLQSLVAQGESETLELKRSTAEPKRAGETLCAFLNSDGGKVLIGVGADGRLVGQEVADLTLRDVAAMLGRFEPPARVEMSRVDVANGRQVIVLDAAPFRQFAPFVFEAKPYKRVGSATTLSRSGRAYSSCDITAEAFHRTGAIEAWGRGTNRVIEACRAYGIPDPTFIDEAGAVTVTFKAEVVAGARDLGPGRHQVSTKPERSNLQMFRARWGNSWALRDEPTRPSSGTKSSARCSMPGYSR